MAEQTFVASQLIVIHRGGGGAGKQSSFIVEALNWINVRLLSISLKADKFSLMLELDIIGVSLSGGKNVQLRGFEIYQVTGRTPDTRSHDYWTISLMCRSKMFQLKAKLYAAKPDLLRKPLLKDILLLTGI